MNRAAFDLIVIGAGPAGSTAAAVSLGGGLTVAQCERRPFPRDKACGGGLTVKAWRASAHPLEPVFRQTHREVECNLWGRKIRRYRLSRPLLATVTRREMDAHLVARNGRMPGFAFFDGEPALRVAYAGVFRVETPRRLLTARQVVCADGASRSISRGFGFCAPRDWAVAVGTQLPRPLFEEHGPCPPRFDLGAAPEGYGWIFPQGDRCSVGIYSPARPLRHPRELLHAYLRGRGIRIPPDAGLVLRGGLIPIGGRIVQVPDMPFYIAGDAGGFADALTGEGLYQAFVGGTLAGETVLQVHRGEAPPRRYYERLHGALLFESRLSYRLCRPFYRRQRLFFLLFEMPFVWRAVLAAAVSGVNHRQSLPRWLPLCLQSFRDGIACASRPWREDRHGPPR